VAFQTPRIWRDLSWRSAFQILQILVEEGIAGMKRTKSKGRTSRSSTGKASAGPSRKRRVGRGKTAAAAAKTDRRSAAKARPRRARAKTAHPENLGREIARPEAAAARLEVGPTSAEIAERAYHLYLERGRVEGSPDADWFAAEMELRAHRHVHH
jgi:hypothetical protein